ncbi:hypothetical protein BSKO_00634 [Bryopsis sp. KO-2023]|nr:hypothetical protein BSKO_00634 [Bryopsis sp. KO-2023]
MVQREKLLQNEVQQKKEEKVQPTLDFAQATTADVAAQSVTKPGRDEAEASPVLTVSKPGENGVQPVAVPNVTTVDPKDPTTVNAQQAETEIKAPQLNTTVESPDALMHAPAPVATGLYGLTAKNILGQAVPLSTYAGNVSIIVNVASYCGFTDTNYKGLEELYQQYKSKGFVVLAFPCNQFGAQEPGSNEDIQSFAASHYNVTFPLFAKTEVNGPNTDPVYKFLKQHLPSEEGGADNVDIDLQWNFQKFLVDRNGFPRKLFYQQFDRNSLEPLLIELLDTPVKDPPS